MAVRKLSSALDNLAWEKYAWDDKLLWKDEPDLDALYRAHSLFSTDPARALTELKALADRGSLMSMVYIADAHTRGTGTKANLTKAEEWYERAAGRGSVLALYRRGVIDLEKKDYAEAKEAFLIGASKGYVPSIRALGKMYAEGLGVDVDMRKARELLERASAHNFAFAKQDLGLLLMRGGFGPLQWVRGLWLFFVSRRAVSGKELNSKLATPCWDNEPEPERLRAAYSLLSSDPAQALNELRALADRGSLMSMVYIAEVYTSGIGTDVDLTQAEKWYQRAADRGSAIASYHCGRIHFEANDYAKAKQAFLIGASKDYMPSIRMLGKMYAKGLDVDVNFDTARELLERASAHGYIFAKRDLAFLLMRGAFGPFQRVRGLWLFLQVHKDIVAAVLGDPTRERLR